MTTSLKDALRAGGVTRNSVPHKDEGPYDGKRPPRNKEEWAIKMQLEGKLPATPVNRARPVRPSASRSEGGPKYIVLQFSKLRDGSVFMPIEKMGKTFYYNKKVMEQVIDEIGYTWYAQRVLHLSERKWQITKDLFIKDSNARSMSLTTGRDAIFALTDWCIVKV